MDILDTHINPNSERFQQNKAHNVKLKQKLSQYLEGVRQGGGERYQKRHQEQGKLFVRDRIDKLIDRGSAFLEIAPLAGKDLYHDTNGTLIDTPRRPHQLCRADGS